MKSPWILFCISIVMSVLLLTGYASADEDNLERVLAVVPVKNGTIDKSVYRQFDKLVPELRKISKNRVLKLECRYSGLPEQERDVESAYKLASMIEKYFREHHKLEHNMWISVDLAPLADKSTHVLTLAVFSDGINKYDLVRIDPLKRSQ